MTSRRAFLHAISGGLAATAAAPFVARPTAAAQGIRGGPPRPFTAGLALQLYSLRHRFKAGDIDGALALTRAFGFEHVEGNAPEGMSSAGFAKKLEAHGLAAMGTGVDFGALSGGLEKAIADAKALGAGYVMCAWIPHDKTFTRADADKAVTAFNAAGKAFKDAGLRFMYHTHGYEFQPAEGGTLFDTIAARTDPASVFFEMDVFWVVRGGGQPVELFERYPKRFLATHVKDMKKGTATGDPTGSAPEETNVVVGQGVIDWPAVFRAAAKGGVEWHIIEDESPDAEKQIPESLKYIASLKL
jgi:sugar phosphate isomerase/epimerase